MGVTLGLLGGLAFAVVKVFGSRHDDVDVRRASDEPWPPLVPDPAAPSPVAPVVAEAVVAPKPATRAAAKAAPAKAWVEPNGAVCPTSHPVKGKLASKIYHLPGMLNYGRTKPDRCYPDAEAAEADGLRAAKR
jgi:hypothetical protein